MISMYRDYDELYGMGDYAVPDPDVSCSLPDLRYVVYIGLGAVVVMCAVGIAVMQRLKHSG